MSFYENFERLCRSKGISPSAGAMKIGRTKSAASAWKANGTIPKQNELEALSEVLNCSVADFFVEGDEVVLEERGLTYIDEVARNEDEMFLLNLYRNASGRDRHNLMDYAYNFDDYLKEKYEGTE